MNVLTELKEILAATNVPLETGVFKKEAPDTYLVLVPLADSYPLKADNKPLIDYQECRITIYSKSNYQNLKKQISTLVLENDFYISERVYNGYDSGTGYHQYSIEVAKQYLMEEN